ncbi:MAG: TerB family tellurite resistance protein [Gammaproteobacteria bacterium]
MSVVDFANIVKFFGGSEPSEDEQKELFKEATMMVLARATSADTNIKKVEVEQVQALLKEATGEDYSTGDIRTAAQSELFETKPLEKYLGGVARKLNDQDRIRIIALLGRIVHSDERVSEMEVNYFNLVCGALNATPAEVFGLVADPY